jgi:hypothetical protein
MIFSIYIYRNPIVIKELFDFREDIEFTLALAVKGSKYKKVKDTCSQADKKIIKQILNIKNPYLEGPSLLEYAVMADNFKMVKLLLEAGADPNLRINGHTAIEIAKTKKNYDVINLLNKYKLKNK